jgi:hypothetical protein
MSVIPSFVRAMIANPGKPGVAKTLERVDGFQSSHDGQVIFGKDIWCDRNPVLISHRVLMMHCRIRHRDGKGLYIVSGADNSIFRYIDIGHASPPNDLTGFSTPNPVTLDDYLESHLPPPVGVGGFGEIVDFKTEDNIEAADCDGLRFHGIRCTNGATGLALTRCTNWHVSRYEAFAQRGPFYRGHAFQANNSPYGLLEDFYFKNDLNDSFVEDNNSIYYSDYVTVRRGLIDGNNAPLGVCSMFESSRYCLAEDIDIIRSGNGGASTYGFFDLGNGAPEVVSHDNTFRRVRVRDTHVFADSPNGGTLRGRPAAGAAFHALGGAYNIRFQDCRYFNIDPDAGASPFEPTSVMSILPNVLLQDNQPNCVLEADITEEDFTPRQWAPLTFPWDDWTGGPFMAALNIGPAEFEPDIDETIADNTFVGELRAESHDPAETFTWSFSEGGYDRFEIFAGHKIRTVADRYVWDDFAIEEIPIRATGSRGNHLDRSLPVVINPILPVGVGLFAGAVEGVIGSGGALPTYWQLDPGTPGNVTIEVLEVVYIHPLWCLRLKVTASPVVGTTPVSIYFPYGIPGSSAFDGETWRIRGYMAREDALVLSGTSLTLLELNGSALVKSHIIGAQLNTDLFNSFSRLSGDFELDGGGSVDNVAGQIYLEFTFGVGDVTDKVQTVVIGAPRVTRLIPPPIPPGSAAADDIVPDLNWWIDASDSGSVTLNGSDVASIADKSGNGFDAAQATAGLQPAYVTAAQNGLNGILFSAANSDALLLAGATALDRNKPGFSFAGVVKIPAFTTDYYLFTVLDSAYGLLFNVQVNATSGSISCNTRRVAADTQSGLYSAATLTAGAAHYVCCTVDYSSGDVVIQIDGTVETQSASWATGAASENVAHVSEPAIGNVYAPLAGYVFEAITAPRALTAGERASLRDDCLKPKWGLA